jgi:hypothetical protein
VVWLSSQMTTFVSYCCFFTSLDSASTSDGSEFPPGFEVVQKALLPGVLELRVDRVRGGLSNFLGYTLLS